MSWDFTGKRVHGVYLQEFPFAGTVSESRVKFGGRVQHTVELDAPINIFGLDRDRILIDTNELPEEYRSPM